MGPIINDGCVLVSIDYDDHQSHKSNRIAQVNDQVKIGMIRD